MSYNLEGNKEKFSQFAANRYRLFWLHAVKHTLLQWESEEDWEKKCRELEEEIAKEETV